MRECKRDQGSCGCCTIYREVNKMETYFDKRLNELEAEYKKAKQSLSDLKASRTAFSVTLLKDGTLKCFGSSASATALIYGQVYLNLGNGYNIFTGMFTVPHSGVYSFAITVYSDTGAPGASVAACAGLQVNDVDVAGSADKNKNDQEDSSSNVVALHLKAGDKVHVNVPAGCFLCDDKYHYNTFSGFLLYPTE
uniref:complement C1q-like protein 2 n=1 Tax=Semicossyphus pulcher TaxID=241346 RepID=UPI0037E941FA